MTAKKLRAQRNKFPNISKADLHMHTNISDGKSSVADVLDYVVKKTDLSVIAITDHDEIEGGYEAREIVKEKGYKIDVVIGEEVTAKEGHIVALFIKEKVEPGMSARETIKKIHEQGGIAVAAHPFYHTRFKSPEYVTLDGVGAVSLMKEKFDAIETVSASPTLNEENLKAKYINRALLFKSELGTSDAHIKEAVGMGYTLFEGKTAKDLEKAVRTGQTQAYLRKWKWNVWGLFKYGYFFLPKTFRNIVWGLRHGFLPREPDIIRLPKDFK
ncbi:MAG: PHP domain-containing protein [bacterium]|nr:PHP domain-containing protein [bacterium]